MVDTSTAAQAARRLCKASCSSSSSSSTVVCVLTGLRAGGAPSCTRQSTRLARSETKLARRNFGRRSRRGRGQLYFYVCADGLLQVCNKRARVCFFTFFTVSFSQVRARFSKSSSCTQHFFPPCKNREIRHLAREYFLARNLARVWFAVQRRTRTQDHCSRND